MGGAAPEATEPPFSTRYLAAKRTVDDRAIHPRVWSTLANALAQTSGRQPLRILEVGAGIGTMIERLVEWGLLAGAGERPVVVHAIDAEPANVASLRERLPAWAAGRGDRVRVDAAEGSIHLVGGGLRLVVQPEAIDLAGLLRRQEQVRTYDLVMAHAFLDLLPLPDVLPGLVSLARPGGLTSFTLTFDGETAFEPVEDPAFDALVVERYHASMDTLSSRQSNTGRRLFHALEALGADVLDFGASDWVVWPRGGRYPADEGVFLHAILGFVEHSLRDDPCVNPNRLADWLSRRHAQVDRGDLFFLAHHLDLVARVARAR